MAQLLVAPEGAVAWEVVAREPAAGAPAVAWAGGEPAAAEPLESAAAEPAEPAAAEPVGLAAAAAEHPQPAVLAAAVERARAHAARGAVW